MTTFNRRNWLPAATLIAALTLPLSTAFAQGNGKGKGGGGDAAYTIVPFQPEGTSRR